jgi:hypothetical protein
MCSSLFFLEHVHEVEYAIAIALGLVALLLILWKDRLLSLPDNRIQSIAEDGLEKVALKISNAVINHLEDTLLEKLGKKRRNTRK